MLSMCRICLVEQGLHTITNTVLEELYEKLTATPFQAVDGRPLQVCYICRARLQNCYRLQASCLQSEELFTQVLRNDNITLVQDKNTFKTVHRLMHFSCAPVTREMRDDEHPDMDPFAITDDNVQVKEEIVEDAQGNICDQDFITEYMAPEEIATTEDDISSYMAHTREVGHNTYAKFAELNEEIDIKPDYIIQSMESQDDLQSDHSTASTEFSDNISIKPVKIVLNGRYLDSIKTGTLADRKMKPDLVKEITRSTARTKKRYQRFSYKVKKGKNIMCSLSKLNKDDGEELYQCDICGKCFDEKCLFNWHTRIQHSDEKPYSCDICKKCFSHKYHLNCHIREHTGEKPYKCHICEKRFSWVWEFGKHIRTHVGEKPYSCDICKKCFTYKGTLSNHIRAHSDEKQYSCNVCKKCFTYKTTLSRHFRLHHCT